MLANILLVDDEEKLRLLLKRIIALEGFKVIDVSNLRNARQILEQENIDIVLCDVKLPDGNGVDFIKEIKEKHPDIEVILNTAFGNISDGVQAIKNGAYDYLVKGNDNDRILPLLFRVGETIALRNKIQRLEKKLGRQTNFDAIIGESAAITESIKLAQKVASTNASVLLTGETGTGKEVFAQAIHLNSPRADKAFVALNCSAFSKDLLESELFGHKAGSFTGATKDKKGLIEEAKGGTLFLDEIGEMPIELQPKILRLLENGTYIRVGDTKEQKADIRIIAATNRDLQHEIAANLFRSDLYYRIAVFNIELAPLRERINDIPLFANYFLDLYSKRINKNIKFISKSALDALKNNNWKGNIRELKNVIERAVIIEDTNELKIDSLPLEFHFAKNDNNCINSVFNLATIEKQHILKVLKYSNGNKAESARLLDISLATLYRKLDEYGVK